jgi:tetratricopeptide (TPR) repeat protein
VIDATIAQGASISVERIPRVLRDTLNRIKQRGGIDAADRELARAHAVAALDRGELEEGRRALLQSIKYGTDSFETMVDVAAELALAGFRADAEHVLRRVLERFPRRVEAKIELARLFLESGNDQKALQLATHALRDHAGNGDLHALAASANEQLGLHENAATHWGAILATAPDHSYANRRLAALLEHMGNTAGAIRCLRRVVEVTRGSDLDGVTSLGIALSADGQHGEAIALLTHVAKSHPDLSAAQADLANALLAADRIEDAITRFSEVLRLDPESAQAYCGLGLAYQRIQRWHEAAEAFRTTEELAPDQAVGPYNLGLALSALGERDEARSALLRAAALEPDDAGIREALQALLVPSPPADPVVTAPRFGGDIRTFALPEVLEFLRLQRKTGSLVVSSRRGAAIIRLAHGRVTSASAPGVGRLGEALVARGIITADALDAALERQQMDDGENAETLGAVLLRERPEHRAALTQAVFQQVIDALDEMLTWKQGAFSFHPGSDRGEPAISFDLQNVVLEVVRIADERKANRSST